jgi:hypothetical protein
MMIIFVPNKSTPTIMELMSFSLELDHELCVGDRFDHKLKPFEIVKIFAISFQEKRLF